MDNIPNSYEETQEYIKKNSVNKRSSFLKSLIIAILSILILFFVWILYPISAPNFAIRSILPADTAISCESHNPVNIIQIIKETDYFNKLYKLPIWSTLEREYQLEFPNTLKIDSKLFLDDLYEQANKFFGVRNIIAITGGISFSEQNKPVYNSIVWLDNIGFLLVKISSYLTSPKKYKNIKYYSFPINSNENFYLTFSQKFPRAVLLTTDLNNIDKFQISKTHNLSTELAKRKDIIEASIFPETFPHNNLFFIPNAQKSEITIRWSIDKIFATGKIILNKPIIDTKEFNHKKITVSSSKPNLSANIKLPEKLISDNIYQLLTNLAKTSDVAIKPFTNPQNISILKQVNGNISLMISDPEKSNSNILQYSHLYFELKDLNNAQKTLNTNLKNIINYYLKSNDIGLQILSSQLNLQTDATTTTLQIPLFPAIEAKFSKIAEIPYAEIKTKNIANHLPEIKESANEFLSIKWIYSDTLAKSVSNSIPKSLKNENILYLNSKHKVKVIDILNFLASSNIFTLNLHNNYDKMNNEIIEFNLTEKLLK